MVSQGTLDSLNYLPQLKSDLLVAHLPSIVDAPPYDCSVGTTSGEKAVTIAFSRIDIDSSYRHNVIACNKCGHLVNGHQFRREGINLYLFLTRC